MGEREKELDFVYFISSPFKNSEENVAASYILHNKEITSEDQVIVLNDDGSIVMNSDISFIDEDGNSTIISRKNTDLKNEQLMVEILKKKDSEDGTPPNDHQANSSTEPGLSENLESRNDSSNSNKRCIDVLNNSTAEIEYQESSKRNDHLVVKHKAVSILRSGTTTFLNPESSNKNAHVGKHHKATSILKQNCTLLLNQESSKENEHPVEKQLKAVSILKVVDSSAPKQDAKSDMPCENSLACSSVNVPNDYEEMEVGTPAENEISVISDGVDVNDLTCEYCLKICSSRSHKYRHLRNFHRIGAECVEEHHKVDSILEQNCTLSLNQEISKENEHPVEKPLETVSNLKSVDASSSNQDANSDMPCENSLACSDVTVPNDYEEMEVGTPAENETSLIPEGVVVDNLTCKYCLKKYSHRSYKNRHIRVFHKICKGVERHIKCIECDIFFKQMEKLREHLQISHKLNMEREEIYLPNMSAFYKWKHEVERRDVASFRIKRKESISDQERKYFFICQQSGKYESQLSGPRKRMLRVSGAYKLGQSLCTAVIFCEERANEVFVRYYPHHYGHGEKIPLVKASTEDQDAAPENETNDIPFENLLDDIHESTFKDYHKMNLIKKKDLKFIRKTFDSDEYISGLSDGESVERWVRLCCQMEDSPVLYYRREEEEFTLVIMTEFQKHILLSSDKQVVSVDSLCRRLCKGVYFHITSIFVMDECEVAFPVAFCISNKVDKNVIKLFLLCIRESTGPLSCTYFVSDWKKYYYEAWVETMNDESKWLWGLWYVDNRHGHQLRASLIKGVSSPTLKGVYVKRAEAYKKFRMMLECQNPNVFETMFKNYVEWLQNDPQSKKLGNLFMQKYGTNKEIWANCYQKDLKLSTLISMELLHRTIRYCCVEGRKKQRLDKFIFVIMKLVRYKMLARLTNILDNEKMDLAIDAIDKCHRIGLDISTNRISSLSDKIWLIRSEADEEDMYITCEFDKCPELCSLRCSECDICVHMYSCSCMQNMINANLCQHIHAIVFKFLRPHFSPMNSPSRDDTEDLENADFTPSKSPSELLLESALKKTHDVYKNICTNKCTLSQESLTTVIQRLNDCLDICSGKKVTDNKFTNTEPLSSFNESEFTANKPFVIKTPSQPFMSPNILPTMLPQNQPLSRYFLVLPDNTNKGTFVQM